MREQGDGPCGNGGTGSQGVQIAGPERCHGCVPRKSRAPEEVSEAEGEQVRQ